MYMRPALARSNAHHVKPPGIPGKRGIALQITQGAMGDLPLFAEINAFRGTAIVGSMAVSYLNKYQTVAVAHDQVDFTGATPVVSRNQFQSLLLEVAAGQIFRAFPPVFVPFHVLVNALLRALPGYCRRTAEPFLNCAHTSSRWIRRLSSI